MTSYAALLTPKEITSVRSRHSIVDVLARVGVDLPQLGSRAGDFMISCPRRGHADNTPSCAVHPAKGTFYCFGCGARGDVFVLVTELTGLTSLTRIAELLDSGSLITPAAGVIVPTRVAMMPMSAGVERPLLDRTSLERVLEVNEEAWRFVTAPRLADRGRLFLSRRGIDVWRLETEVGRPLIGHTPMDRGALSAHLRRRGFTSDEIIDAGWALRHPDHTVDRFRGRALFPIRDTEGRIVGVIGRDITDRARQKYLNTARTIAFRKGSVLYRPTPAPVAHEATVIVCEGPLDALAIAASVAQRDRSLRVIAVAPSGTALTIEHAGHVAALSTYPPILCADGDVTASLEWAETFRSLGGAPRTATLPAGHDPASWLAEHGSNGLAALLHPTPATVTAVARQPPHRPTGARADPPAPAAPNAIAL
jgi:DNA primase